MAAKCGGVESQFFFFFFGCEHVVFVFHFEFAGLAIILEFCFVSFNLIKIKILIQLKKNLDYQKLIFCNQNFFCWCFWL